MKSKHELNGAADRYEAVHQAFRWDIPPHVNIGLLCADRHRAKSIALIDLETSVPHAES